MVRFDAAIDAAGVLEIREPERSEGGGLPEGDTVNLSSVEQPGRYDDAE